MQKLKDKSLASDTKDVEVDNKTADVAMVKNEEVKDIKEDGINVEKEYVDEKEQVSVTALTSEIAKAGGSSEKEEEGIKQEASEAEEEDDNVSVATVGQEPLVDVKVTAVEEVVDSVELQQGDIGLAIKQKMEGVEYLNDTVATKEMKEIEQDVHPEKAGDVDLKKDHRETIETKPMEEIAEDGPSMKKQFEQKQQDDITVNEEGVEEVLIGKKGSSDTKLHSVAS